MSVTTNVTFLSKEYYYIHQSLILSVLYPPRGQHSECYSQSRTMEKVNGARHFLIVAYPVQSHINPALELAHRLARTAPGARITFSTAVSAHRKMFPGLASPDQEFDDGGCIAYVPFSDGYDQGFNPAADDIKTFASEFKANVPPSLSSIIDRLDSRGQRVDCVVYTFVMYVAAAVADRHAIPSVQYWIQPATVFAVYYHCFHGYDLPDDADSSTVIELPGLRPMRYRDLPSFLLTANSVDEPYYSAVNSMREAFATLDRPQSTAQKQKVLVNTFGELEPNALGAVESLDLIPVGSIPSSSNSDLFESDGKGYMEWLDSKPEKSVVYVSFGSLLVIKKEQLEEISKGLRASGRPYLWVVRRDNRHEGAVLDCGEDGMVVEWCSQVRVLSHPSVGCFVTHCGWNSTLESLACGVPTVGYPEWTDQGTNAMLMEEEWGTGVRVEVNGEGVLEAAELERCLRVVMGEGEGGAEIRRKAEMWKAKARAAVAEGGSSDRNLRAFVEQII